MTRSKKRQSPLIDALQAGRVTDEIGLKFLEEVFEKTSRIVSGIYSVLRHLHRTLNCKIFDSLMLHEVPPAKKRPTMFKNKKDELLTS